MVRYEYGRYDRKLNACYEALEDLKFGYEEYISENDNLKKSRRLRTVTSAFYDISEFFLSACEGYAVENNIKIQPENYYTIVESSSKLLGKENCDFLKVLCKYRNKHIHDYYKREVINENILKIVKNDFSKIVANVKLFDEYFQGLKDK